ncbi:MAG: hypothetical protein R6U66_04045 [Bacteroidales bacterium]
MRYVRNDFEPPAALKEWGWKYHHMGIPTSERRSDERYIAHLKFYVSGFPTSPYGIEWMRFEPDCPLPELVKKVPHIAFEVQDLDKALEKGNFQLLTPPNPPSEGVRVAMIEHNGAPVELIEFGSVVK